MEIVIYFLSCLLGNLAGFLIARCIDKFIINQKLKKVVIDKKNIFRPASETAKKTHEWCEHIQKNKD